VLRDVEGLSAEEAAAVAGVEVGALKSRLHRARLELRSHLAVLLGEASPVAGPSPCPELANELAAYTSADIDQATCVKIEEHLARCPRCQGACEALKRTVGLCRRIPGDEVPAPVRAAVRRSLRALLGSP
jgi:RNA polymerase sigma-70 factor, ECF subfamily